MKLILLLGILLLGGCAVDVGMGYTPIYPYYQGYYPYYPHYYYPEHRHYWH